MIFGQLVVTEVGERLNHAIALFVGYINGQHAGIRQFVQVAKRAVTAAG